MGLGQWSPERERETMNFHIEPSVLLTIIQAVQNGRESVPGLQDSLLESLATRARIMIHREKQASLAALPKD